MKFLYLLIFWMNEFHGVYDSIRVLSLKDHRLFCFQLIKLI